MHLLGSTDSLSRALLTLPQCINWEMVALALLAAAAAQLLYILICHRSAAYVTPSGPHTVAPPDMLDQKSNCSAASVTCAAPIPAAVDNQHLISPGTALKAAAGAGSGLPAAAAAAADRSEVFAGSAPLPQGHTSPVKPWQEKVWSPRTPDGRDQLPDAATMEGSLQLSEAVQSISTPGNSQQQHQQQQQRTAVLAASNARRYSAPAQGSAPVQFTTADVSSISDAGEVHLLGSSPVGMRAASISKDQLFTHTDQQQQIVVAMQDVQRLPQYSTATANGRGAVAVASSHQSGGGQLALGVIQQQLRVQRVMSDVNPARVDLSHVSKIVGWHSAPAVAGSAGSLPGSHKGVLAPNTSMPSAAPVTTLPVAPAEPADSSSREAAATAATAGCVPADTAAAALRAVPDAGPPAPSVQAHTVIAPAAHTGHSSMAAVRQPTRALGRPSALYSSPMQHLTVSIKVPNPWSYDSAQALRGRVPQQLINAAAAQHPPQHTIVHMVTVPGCIQLLMTVMMLPADQAVTPSQQQQLGEQRQQHAATGQLPQQQHRVPTAAPEQQESGELATAYRTTVLTAQQAWIAEGLAPALEEFMRLHPMPPIPQPSQHQYGHAASQQPQVPVIQIEFGGQCFRLQPDPADAAARWRLHQVVLAEVPHVVGGQAGTAAIAETAAAAAAASQTLSQPEAGRPSSIDLQGRTDLQLPASGLRIVVPEPAIMQPSEALTATAPATAGSGLPASRHMSSLEQQEQQTANAARANPANVAGDAARQFAAPQMLQTAEAVQGGLQQPANRRLPNSVWAWPMCLPVSVNASIGTAVMPQNAAGAGIGGTSSNSRAIAAAQQQAGGLSDAGWLPMGPPDAMAACVAGITGYYNNNSGNSSSTSAYHTANTIGSGESSSSSQQVLLSSLPPPVEVHGLPGQQCQLVVGDSAGSVLADCVCQVHEAIGRIQPPPCRSLKVCRVYVMTPRTAEQPTVETESTQAATVLPPPAPAGGAAEAAAPAAAAVMSPRGLLYCTFPLLYLPAEVVRELHEAARKVMLEQAHARILHEQQEQQQQRQQGATTATAEYVYMSQTPPEGAYLTGLASWASLGNVAGRPVSQRAQDNSGNRHIGSFDTQLRARTPSVSSRRLANSSTRLYQVPEIQPAGPCYTPFATNIPSDACLAANEQRASTNTVSTSRLGSDMLSGQVGSTASSVLPLQTVHQLNLRGRLFEGHDVHQLLQEQYLAMLSDLGMLIELAASASAAIEEPVSAAAATVEAQSATGAAQEAASSMAASQPAAAATAPGTASSSGQHVQQPDATTKQTVAATLGHSLISWLACMGCWSACQLVITLLLDMGVPVHLQGEPTRREEITTADAVKQLLLGDFAAAVQQQQTGAGVVTTQGSVIPSGSSGSSVLATSRDAQQLGDTSRSNPEQRHPKPLAFRPPQLQLWDSDDNVRDQILPLRPAAAAGSVASHGASTSSTSLALGPDPTGDVVSSGSLASSSRGPVLRGLHAASATSAVATPQTEGSTIGAKFPSAVVEVAAEGTGPVSRRHWSLGSKSRRFRMSLRDSASEMLTKSMSLLRRHGSRRKRESFEVMSGSHASGLHARD